MRRCRALFRPDTACRGKAAGHSLILLVPAGCLPLNLFRKLFHSDLEARMQQSEPVPEPSGALQPPNRLPPTAIGAATPDPDPRPAPRPSIPVPSRPSRLEQVLEAVLLIPVLVVGAAVYPFTKKARRRRQRHRA